MSHAHSFSLGVKERGKKEKQKADVLFWVLKCVLFANHPRAELLAGCEPKKERKKERS